MVNAEEHANINGQNGSNANNIAHKITDLIGRYRIISENDQFDKTGRDKLLSQISAMVKNEEAIQMILPGFAFKSPNDDIKVIGKLPDKAEELALLHLDGLCDSIKEIYSKGARLTIVSDGLVYNDLLHVADEDVWRYSIAIREMSKDIRAEHIHFVRVSELLGETAPQTEEEYLTRVKGIRTRLFEEYLPAGYDFEQKLKEDADVLATHQSYIKVVKKDLAKVLNGSAPEVAEKMQSDVAKQMIQRGQCFANIIASKYSSHVRLSIHPSNNINKLSISLFPGKKYATIPITPWHSTIFLDATGNFDVLLREDISDSKTKTQVILKDDKPWLMREIDSVYEWEGMDIAFEPLYPCGIMVKPTRKGQIYNFVDVDMQKVRRLALSNAPVILRGFAMPVEKEIFRRKAAELGEIQMWPFGDILEVRENADLNMNNVLTREDMPFHYDGCFKMVENDKGEVVPKPPLFQMFRNKASTAVGGLTLFSSSKLLLELLPSDLSFERLKNLEWSSYTPENDAFGGKPIEQPLISPHPVNGAPTIRFHEPWPETKTASCQPTYVSILGVSKEESDEICEKLTVLLYDRRICYRHQWQEGDFLFNDNMATHHTRTAYQTGYRELWRVHVDAAW
ncbi:uncharacterized protein VTP21DRAFT_9058 [Calcarisporiella thermophila]|uniref:uncharacterized protein n=1 Tax=Calcarisporiella thermophila TaxID=911321 RepID=UPI003743D3F0